MNVKYISFDSWSTALTNLLRKNIFFLKKNGKNFEKPKNRVFEIAGFFHTFFYFIKKTFLRDKAPTLAAWQTCLELF